MNWEQKLSALQAIAATNLQMRAPGYWYVSADSRDVCEGNGRILCCSYGNGATPEAAVTDDWAKIATPGHVIKTRRGYVRWNGWMWADVPVDMVSTYSRKAAPTDAEIAELRRLHAEAVANKHGNFEVDCDEAFRIAFMKDAPRLLDEIERLGRLMDGVMHFVDKWLDSDWDREQNPVERANQAREVALKEIERLRAELDAIDTAIADRGVPEMDCTLPLPERVSNLIGALKEWRHSAATEAMEIERLRAELDDCRKTITQMEGWMGRNTTRALYQDCVALRAELAMANERVTQSKERLDTERNLTSEMHRERERIIKHLGLTEADPGFHDGFAWNLSDRVGKLRAELEQQRTRAEAAEVELRERGAS